MLVPKTAARVLYFWECTFHALWRIRALRRASSPTTTPAQLDRRPGGFRRGVPRRLATSAGRRARHVDPLAYPLRARHGPPRVGRWRVSFLSPPIFREFHTYIG